MPTTFYTDSDEIAEFLGVVPFRNDPDGTKPTKDAVDRWINRVENRIDYDTEHAWREKSITEEFADFASPFGKLFLRHRDIKPLDSGQGDKIEVASHLTTGVWTDFLTTYTQSDTIDDNKDYFFDRKIGTFTFKSQYPSLSEIKFRLSYRYGSDSDSEDFGEIKDATIYRVAYEMLINNRYHDFMTNPGKDVPALLAMAEKWNEEYKDIIRRLSRPHRDPQSEVLGYRYYYNY
jgi:hypothetical protein